MATRKQSVVEKTVSADPIDVDLDLDAPADAPVPPAGGGKSAAHAHGAPHVATGAGAWVVAPAATLADAPVGSSGHLMGIKIGVDTKAGPFAAWLGTTGPRTDWP
ncbi:MAG: hypothetical protein ACO29V_15115, partial [Limnohabitans sp.]